MQSNTSAENHALRIEAQPIGLFETPIAYGRLKDADTVMRELEELLPLYFFYCHREYKFLEYIMFER